MNQGISAIFSGMPVVAAIFLLLLTAVLSYFLGCLNGAVVVSKYILQDDIREHGSGNAGLTNFYRTFGGKLTLLVLAADMIKMFLAVFFAQVLFSIVLPEVPIFVKYWAGIFCALGHMFPIMFQFRGGKGILSGGALALTLDWRIALSAWLIFIIIVALTKLVSLGSCCTGAVFPISSILVYRSPSILIISLCIGALLLWQHRSNLVRLYKGKESKFSFRRKQVNT